MNNKLPTGSEWTFGKIQEYSNAIDEIATNTFKLDTYPNQIEIITSEQMIDCYASVGLPVGYKHWSYGREFIRNMQQYKRGQMGLAYEIVINSNPTIAYLMEENTLPMQALVIAHACYGHNCFSEDTEILTKTGWKTHDQVDEGDIIATLNRDTKMIEYNPVDKKFLYDYAGEMCLFENSTADHLVTPNHNMVYTSSGVVEECTAENWTATGTYAITSGVADIPSNKNYSVDELRLLAWCITGNHLSCVHTNKWKFSFLEDYKINRFRELLDTLYIEYHESVIESGDVTKFSVNLDDRFRRDIPSDLLLSQEQFNTFVSEWLYIDGSNQDEYTNNTSGSLITNKKHNVDKIQELAAICGAKSCYDINENGVYTISIVLDESEVQMSQSPLTDTVQYTGKVWCVSVKNHTIVSRRNGKVLITGNSFFKNNYLFKERTQADTIIDFMVYAQRYIKDLEQSHGVDVVEEFIDHAHALRNQGFDHFPRKPHLSKSEMKKAEQQSLEEDRRNASEFWSKVVPLSSNQDNEDSKFKFPKQPHENLLHFFEKYAPNLEDWQREILRIVRKMQEYFHPQGQTQVGNEGFATFTHYNIIHELDKQGRVDESFMMELLKSHTNVIAQPSYRSKYYNGINVYALGFAMFQDIKRMCEQPTKEDEIWFPDVVGRDWIEVTQEAAFNHRDESFIKQYLSPKVMRDMKLFAMKNDNALPYQEIVGIHDDSGYHTVRNMLAEQKNRFNLIPQVEVTNVDIRGNRMLTLTHTIKNGTLLSEQSVYNTLHHVQAIWGFDVELLSVDAEGETQSYYHFEK